MTDRTEEEKVKTLHICYVTYIASNCAEMCMQIFPYGRKKPNQPSSAETNHHKQAEAP